MEEEFQYNRRMIDTIVSDEWLSAVYEINRILDVAPRWNANSERYPMESAVYWCECDDPEYDHWNVALFLDDQGKMALFLDDGADVPLDQSLAQKLIGWALLNELAVTCDGKTATWTRVSET